MLYYLISTEYRIIENLFRCCEVHILYLCTLCQQYVSIWFMVYNATFNDISVISWRSVLFVEETGGPRERFRLVASHRQTLPHNVVSSTPRHEWGSNMLAIPQQINYLLDLSISQMVTFSRGQSKKMSKHEYF